MQQIPEWLKPCTTIGYRRDNGNGWIVSFVVAYKEPLRAEEHWEEIDGNWYVVRVDPRTLERSVVFRTPSRTEVYFEAAVDPETAKVTVLIDRDLSSIAGEQLMRSPARNPA